MPSADLVLPARMSRVAVVAPAARVREALVELATAGLRRARRQPAARARARRPRRCGGSTAPAAAAGATPALLATRAGRGRARAGGRARACSPARSSSSGARALARRPRQLRGLGRLGADGARSSSSNERLAEVGAAVVELPRPAWVEPPTLLPAGRGRAARSGRSCRPTARRATATSTRPRSPPSRSSLMFGMMFGDVGHGLVLALLALWLRRAARGRLAAVPAALADPVRRRARRRVLRPALRRGVRADRTSCRGSGSTRSTGRCRCSLVARRGRGGAARGRATCSGSSTAGARAASARRCSPSPGSPASRSSSAAASLAGGVLLASARGRDRRAARRRRPALAAARRSGSSLAAGGGAAAVTQAGDRAGRRRRPARLEPDLVHAARGVRAHARGARRRRLRRCAARSGAAWSAVIAAAVVFVARQRSSPSRSRRSSRASRRCGSSTTSSSPASSPARATPSPPGACPSFDRGGVMIDSILLGPAGGRRRVRRRPRRRCGERPRAASAACSS